MDNVSCILDDGGHSVICNGEQYHLPEQVLTWQDRTFWLFLFGYVFLVLFAGMMSGLTLAIFSLDLTSLKVLARAGSPKDQSYALHIMSLAQKQYLVLVSLVLSNALAVEAMPLLLDRISSPAIAISVSVSAVLIFGEVLPQAVCGRYGLPIGYYFSWLVWTLIAILFIIAWPVSKMLECILGRQRGTFYRRAELKALVDIHGPKKKRTSRKKRNPLIEKFAKRLLTVTSVDETRHFAERLSDDEVQIIRGALELATKKASDAMVDLDKVYMLSTDTVLNKEKLQEILEMGHSRIPIIEDSDRQQVIGILLTKRLITGNPRVTSKVSDFIKDSRYFYQMYSVDENTPLYSVLKNFQSGKLTHMAIVTRMIRETAKKIVGLITLEDIIEELILNEIYDETDNIRAKQASLTVKKHEPTKKITAKVPKS